MTRARIGVIGGSGLYQMEGLQDMEEVSIDTPFGQPSGIVTLGLLEGERLAFLPRHGREHQISPTYVPVQANIYALKSLGVEQIVSVSAVGSLKEEIKPMDMVIPDQIIDRTRSRVNSFFGERISVHTAFADPFCSVLSQILHGAAKQVGARVHQGGTYVAIEGPLFSTRAESNLYRNWGTDIIGMTAVPEAKLAREAEICYSTLACVTDYDCWHSDHESVTIDMVIANLRQNVDTAKKILRLVIKNIPPARECACATALENAIVTAPDQVSPQIKKELALLIGKYLPYERKQ